MRISPGLTAPFINIFYRLWCSTLRIRQTGRKLEELEEAGTPAMVCLWHDEVFALMHVRRALRVVTIVSQSRDGEYLARLLQALGLTTARGSSSRGGLKALLRMARLMRGGGYTGCITVDGPRGPRHVAKPGAFILSFHAQVPIVPVRLFPHRAKIFRSWDRFQLPLPFSRVDIVFGEPYMPQMTELTDDVLERECRELERRLEALHPLEL